MFLQCFVVHCLMIEILPRVLNMDCNLFTYLCFILLRGDLNICGIETWKIDRLVLQFYGCFALQVFELVT